VLYRMEVRRESLKPWLKYSFRIALRITGPDTIRTFTFSEDLTSYRGGYRLRVTVWRFLIQNSVTRLVCVYIFSTAVRKTVNCSVDTHSLYLFFRHSNPTVYQYVTLAIYKVSQASKCYWRSFNNRELNLMFSGWI